MTISDFDEILYGGCRSRKKNIPKILDFLVAYGSKYGSVNFDLYASTRDGQMLISQLLWDLQSSSWYLMKGI